MCIVFHLVGFEFTDEFGVGDFFAAVSGDIPVPYCVEGFGAFDTLRCVVWDFSDALVEATKLV